MTAQPNFLFLFPDQLRWDWIGAAGHVPVRTPNIDRLAASGVRFDRVWCNSPLCAPSRACLATGSRYPAMGVRNNQDDLDPAADTYMQRLRDAGYRTATVGKCDLHKGSNDFSADGWAQRLGRYGFTEALDQGGKWCCAGRIASGQPEAYTAHLAAHGLADTFAADMTRRRQLRTGDRAPWHDTSASPLPRRQYTDDFCGAAAQQQLERFPEGAPWYLWVNFPGPHEPFDPPQELRQRYDGVDFAGPAPADPAREEDHLQIRRNFAAMIEGIDEWIGRLVDVVAARGELDRTVFVVSSDHGEMLGDRGLWYKQHPWEPSIHVPLVVSGPPVVDPGRSSAALVELIDLAATFVDLAGVPAADWDARSIAPVLSGAAHELRSYQVAAFQDWRAVSDGTLKLIEYQSGARMLYDLAADPTEEHDLSGEAAHAGTLDRLQGLLAEASPWPGGPDPAAG